MKMKHEVVAGIVLYNPEIKKLKENIDGIYKQVERIILVDNCSNNKAAVERLSREYDNIIMIWNESNLGIAAALNQIAKKTIDLSYEWVLLLDQDSVAGSNMVEQYHYYMNDKTISIVCPRIIDRNYPVGIAEGIVEIHCSKDVITSGSCIRINDWLDLGGFDERLFIDFVDTEYQERCLRSGRRIIKVSDAILYHEVGSMMEKSFMGMKVLCSNHSSVRRYYMVRNRLYFMKKYFGTLMYIKEKIRLFLGMIKICLYEDDKVNKVKATMKGFRDYRKLL